jgi:hypothetical protein
MSGGRSKTHRAALQEMADAGGELTWFSTAVKASVPETLASRGLAEYVPPANSPNGMARWRITNNGRDELERLAVNA